jgi:hypothetical protein
MKLAIPLSEQQVRLYHSLAQEIVQAYQSKENILKGLNITEAQYIEISQTAAFQRLVQQAMNEWNGAGNSAKRVRLKSQWAIEEGLPFMFQSMTDSNEPLSARVEAFKAISKIGQLDTQEINAGADRSFRIEINIGQGVTPVTINSAPTITIENEPIKEGFDIENEPNYKPGLFLEEVKK